MAFRLTKAEAERSASLIHDLQTLRDKLEDEVNVYNLAVLTLRKPVEDALAAYNEAVGATRGFAEDIANAATDDIDDKSEKWQDSDKGQAASQWRDEWAAADFSEIEICWPDDLEISDADLDHAGRLEQLPEAAE